MALLKMLLPFPNRDLTALTDFRDLLFRVNNKKVEGEKSQSEKRGGESV